MNCLGDIMKQAYILSLIFGIIIIGVLILVLLPKQQTIDLNYTIKLADYNDLVTVDYELIVDGNILDSSYDRNEPLVFTIGDGKMIKGFENGILGMQEGQEKTIIIKPEEGYGSANDFPYKFQEDLNAVLTVINKQTGKDVNADMIQGGMFYNMYGQKCIFQGFDLNQNKQNINCQHKLAGKILNFRVKLLKIENNVDNSIEIKNEDVNSDLNN